MSSLAQYYADQEKMSQAAIRRGSLVLSESDLENDAALSLASGKEEIAAVKSISSNLSKTIADQLKAISKAKDAGAVKAAVEEAQTAISKQLKRLSAYASNLEGDDDEEIDDVEVDEVPLPKKGLKKGVKPQGKEAKAVAASHRTRRSLRLGIDEDMEAQTWKDAAEHAQNARQLAEDGYELCTSALDELMGDWKYEKTVEDARKLFERANTILRQVK